MVTQRICICHAVLLLTLIVRPARADHFAIDLEARSGAAKRTAKTETAALAEKSKARAVLEAKAGKPITVKWAVTSTAKNGMVKDALIHFFVVKEEKVGQVALPKLDKQVTVESALTMDFKPKDKTEAELSFTIDTPGSYLLRLETRDSAGKEGHEHYAAMDLVV